jgi:hypothetical protein
MLTSIKTGPVLFSDQLRLTARASAAVLVVTWLAFIVSEVMRPGFGDLGVSHFGQAVSLAVVFAGYAIGFRNELAGGAVAIVGTLAFFAVVLATSGQIPGLAAVLFAIPGVLYLLAWHYDERRRLRL